MTERKKKKTERYGERRERGQNPVPLRQNPALAPDSKSPGLTTLCCPGVKCYFTHLCILILDSLGGCKKTKRRKKKRRLSWVNFPPSFNLQVQFAKPDFAKKGVREKIKLQITPGLASTGGRGWERGLDHLCLKAGDKATFKKVASPPPPPQSSTEASDVEKGKSISR